MGLFLKGTMIPHGWTEKDWKEKAARDTKEAIRHMHDQAKEQWAARQNAIESPEQ